MRQRIAATAIGPGEFDFTCSEDIGRVMAAQNWPLAPTPLDDPGSIDALSVAWVQKNKIGCFFAVDSLPEAERVHLPSPEGLFSLAADFIVGSHPSMLGSRLQITREMCRLPARSLFGVLPQRKKKGKEGSQEDMHPRAASGRQQLNREKSAKTQVSHFESGRRRPSTAIVAELAKLYHVDKTWLERGVSHLPGVEHELFPYQRRTIDALKVVPHWLHDYLSAVDSALHVLEELGEPVESSHQALMALFTTEADWIFSRPSRARWLVYFPQCHAAIMAARDRYIANLPRSLRPARSAPLIPKDEHWTLLSSGRLRPI